MSVVEFSGHAGSFATADGRVRRVFVAGTILFGASAPDEAPDAGRAEELVLAAANAVLAARDGEGSGMLEELGSADTQYALGRRVEQRVVADLPALVTARVLELHVRSADEMQPTAPADDTPTPEPAEAAPAEVVPVEAAPAEAAPAEAAPAEVVRDLAAPAIGKGSRVYVAGSDGRWYPGMCLEIAPGYVLVDLGGGRVEWVGATYCAPG